MTCFFSASYSYWWRWLHMLQRKVCENISTARWLLSFLATWQFASLLPPCPGFRWIAQNSRMSFIPHIFCTIIFPRLLKLTVAAVFYQATSSRSWFWKQRYSYMLILSPVFLPRILLLPQRHCHQHLFTVQHDLSNFSKGSAESKLLNISWGHCECVCDEKWSLSQAVSWMSVGTPPWVIKNVCLGRMTDEGWQTQVTEDKQRVTDDDREWWMTEDDGWLRMMDDWWWVKDDRWWKTDDRGWQMTEDDGWRMMREDGGWWRIAKDDGW